MTKMDAEEVLTEFGRRVANGENAERVIRDILAWAQSPDAASVLADQQLEVSPRTRIAL